TLFAYSSGEKAGKQKDRFPHPPAFLFFCVVFRTKKPRQWRGSFDKNDKGTIKVPFTQGQQACHHLIATPGFLFGSLTSPIRVQRQYQSTHYVCQYKFISNSIIDTDKPSLSRAIPPV
ncbi:hypothetical protein, partial [Escherichia coli]|uniref:hypothetical protein n=1 Tax=Escherichia coli TaxID=562 RepID=UPI001BC89A53